MSTPLLQNDYFNQLLLHHRSKKFPEPQYQRHGTVTPYTLELKFHINETTPSSISWVIFDLVYMPIYQEDMARSALEAIEQHNNSCLDVDGYTSRNANHVIRTNIFDPQEQ